MKTTLKIAAIALILGCVLSGCISDDAKDSIIEKAVETAIEKATQDMMFGITFYEDMRNNPYEVQVAINEGGSAIIRTNGEVIFGTWEIYRETSAGDMYDITYDDTELRIYMQTSGIAVGNWYEKEFTKCGESSYGNWQANPMYVPEPTPTPVSTPSTLEKNAYMDEMPKTVLLHGMTKYDIDIKQYILFDDKTVELCSVGEISTGTWKAIYRTPDTRTYTISIKNRYTGKTSSTNLIVDYDSTAELELDVDKSYYGTWSHGIDRSKGTCTDVVATPAPTEGIPMTAWIKGALPTDMLRFVFEDDGTFELYSRDEYTYGEYKVTAIQSVTTPPSTTYYIEMDPNCYFMQYDDGSATLRAEGTSMKFKGSWVEGIHR